MQRGFPPLPPGMRVIADMTVALIDDFGCFADGEKGRALHVDADSALAWIAFDHGGSSLVPLALLAEPSAESRRAGRMWLKRGIELGTNLGQSIPPQG
ncbi:hypothetical protein [Variovorax sp. LARHSF232]